MIVHIGVLLALFGADVANLCAQAASLAGKLAVDRHKLHCAVADIDAIDVKPNAVGHHFYIVLRKTTVDAVSAGYGAFLTGLDT